MMGCLAKSHCQDAAPILMEYVEDPNVSAEEKTQAKVALNRLGRSVETGKPDGQYEIAANLEPLLMADWAQRSLELLDALIAHDATAGLGQMTVTAMVRQGGDGTTIRGVLPEEGSAWEITFRGTAHDRVPFDFSWRKGPKYGRGYDGLLVKRTERWLLVSYRMRWIS